MKKDKANKKLLTFISIFASLFVYVGAIVIFLYANGWRIDLFNQLVVKTGVLTVESDPFLADLYIDDVNKGRTPKSTSLDIGEYNIRVKRNGYYQWTKKVEIKEEKSTPLFPWLIKEVIEKENIYSIEGKKYIDSWISEDRNHIFILTNSYDETTLLYTYELWLYNVNTTFWDLSANPKVILTSQSTTESTISLVPSPNGQYAVLRHTMGDLTTPYLLDISKSSTLEELSVLDITQFDTYEMHWSRNNKYLLFESDQDLISFSIDRQTKYLLIIKAEENEYIWNTDEQGYFYTVEIALEKETEKVYAYVLTQEEMDGTDPKVLVNDLFFQKNQEYILKYREEKSLDMYSAFTNSTASTRSVGKVESFRVNQGAQGIYIQTETSSYWYNIKTKRYHLISPYESELVYFSPDSTMLLYKDTQGYSVFTFLNEKNDPNIVIGSKRVIGLDLNNSQILGWLSNSLYISYIQENSAYILDKDGDNIVKVLDNTNLYKYIGVTNSRDYLFTVSITQDTIPGLITIDRYSIH